MRSSTRKLSQISLLLILILKTSLVLSTKPENSMIVNLLEESSSSDRFLQNNNNNNNNNQYSCETGKWCTLTIRQGNLGVQYSIVMNPNSYLTTMVSLVSTPDSALTIAYSSSSASTDIETELTVSGYGQRSLTLEIPTTNSFSAVVSQDTIEQYDGGAVYFSVDNGSSGSTTVTIKATFASGSSSSSSGSGSYTSADNGGVSMMTIILPIAAALLIIFILGLCCHYRRKRLEQQRMARAMGGRHRVRGARRDRGGDQQADDEESEDDEVEDPLTEDNIKDRFPEAKFDALKSSFPQTTCSVCLEEFQKGVACRQLYCEHMFHSECIRLWLTNQLKKGHAFCPNCNKNMMNKQSDAPEAPEGPEVPEEPEAQAPNVEIQA